MTSKKWNPHAADGPKTNWKDKASQRRAVVRGNSGGKVPRVTCARRPLVPVVVYVFVVVEVAVALTTAQATVDGSSGDC